MSDHEIHNLRSFLTIICKCLIMEVEFNISMKANKQRSIIFSLEISGKPDRQRPISLPDTQFRFPAKALNHWNHKIGSCYSEGNILNCRNGLLGIGTDL